MFYNMGIGELVDMGQIVGGVVGFGLRVFGVGVLGVGLVQVTWVLSNRMVLGGVMVLGLVKKGTFDGVVIVDLVLVLLDAVVVISHVPGVGSGFGGGCCFAGFVVDGAMFVLRPVADLLLWTERSLITFASMVLQLGVGIRSFNNIMEHATVVHQHCNGVVGALAIR